jgi:hypothetical protein
MSKVGRNDPCPCGSGRKYKKCHPGEYDLVIGQPGPLSEMPIVFCASNDDFYESGLATVIIVRQVYGGGKFDITTFLCDIFCLGVKDIAFYPHAGESTLATLLGTTPQTFEEMSYADARDLILGSVEYAQSLGFEPYRDFKHAKATIEADLPYDAGRYTYGRNGRPMYITGPHDDYGKVFSVLEASCGKGGFGYYIDSRAKYVYPKP